MFKGIGVLLDMGTFSTTCVFLKVFLPCMFSFGVFSLRQLCAVFMFLFICRKKLGNYWGDFKNFYWTSNFAKFLVAELLNSLKYFVRFQTGQTLKKNVKHPLRWPKFNLKKLFRLLEASAYQSKNVFHCPWEVPLLWNLFLMTNNVTETGKGNERACNRMTNHSPGAFLTSKRAVKSASWEKKKDSSPHK